MTGPLTPASYLHKAEQALSGARLLLNAGDTDGACSRAYYAMFDAAHAALRAAGIELAASPIKTHNGLVGMFGLHLVRGGHIAVEHGEALNKVQTLRELADYSGDPISADRASWACERAEAFVAAVKVAFGDERR